MRRAPAALAVLAAAALALAACGGSSDAEGRACANEVHEALDPNSGQHLLPGAPAPRFASNPPTSGPHMLGKWPTGVLHEPIARPVQVALLEVGEVLVQYRPGDVDPAPLEALAEEQPRLTVAPNPTLPTPVAATAWTYKLECRRVSVPDLRRFVEAHAGKGAS